MHIKDTQSDEIIIILQTISTTCQYKSNDKKFRIAFIITIGIATALLRWANASVKKQI